MQNHETQSDGHIQYTKDIHTIMPTAGSGVVRIDPPRFLAGCRT